MVNVLDRRIQVWHGLDRFHKGRYCRHWMPPLMAFWDVLSRCRCCASWASFSAASSSSRLCPLSHHQLRDVWETASLPLRFALSFQHFWFLCLHNFSSSFWPYRRGRFEVRLNKLGLNRAKTTHTAYGPIGVAPQNFVCPLLYDQTKG